MSLFITNQGFNVESSIQAALSKNNSLFLTGHLLAGFSKSIFNIIAAPIHNLGLALKNACSFKWKKSITHIKDIFISPISNLFLSAVLAITLVAAPIFGTNAINFAFDGKQPFHEEKYRIILNQYKVRLLSDLKETTIKELIQTIEKDFDRKLQLKNKVLDCLRCLDEPQNPRKAYQQFVKNLDRASRIILAKPDKYKKSILGSLAKNLARIRWSEINLRSHFDKRIQEATNYTTEQSFPTSFNKFPDSIKSINKKIKAASPKTRKSWISLQYQKFRGTLGVENFTGRKNTPNKLATFTFENEKTISYLRHGSPTSGKNGTLRNASEKIVPNYELFILDAKEKNQGVFYAIHQRISGSTLQLDDERGRTRAILALQNKYKNFHAVVQPVEGSFFNGNGKNTTFNTLKKEILSEFFENLDKPKCILPKACKLDLKYREDLEKLIDVVKETFFNEETVFNPEMRQNFILFFYALQRIELKTRLDEKSYPISYYVTACKDNLDRGGGQALLELIIHLILTEKINDPEILRDVITNILGAPIIVKQKAMLFDRLNPILNAINHIIANEKTISSFLKLEFNEKPYKVKSVTFPQPSYF